MDLLWNINKINALSDLKALKGEKASLSLPLYISLYPTI